ncbi:hypothetical protein ACFWUP_21965 [Nocardia sp. NPDC058658]|uniref:hypothetical protein n=1 Tax=Nocardia sp. NPDC058658 TaxID=3346580 RepID=UPI00365FC018
MMEVDYGQAQIKAMSDAVAAGTLKFDPAAVADVVKVLDGVIDELDRQRLKMDRGAKNTGLAGFPSAQQLAVGFSGKADQMVDTIDQYIVGTIRLQETFLRAAGKYAEADQMNARAIAAASAAVPGRTT